MIIDCNPWGDGCYGGYVSDTFKYWLIPYAVKPNLEKDYPYKASQGICQSSTLTQYNMTVSNIIELYSATGSGLSTVSMINLLTTYGPYATYLDASSTLFGYYTSGILNNSCCWSGGYIDYANLSLTNHAIITVGYGISSGKSYWIMRNSWGSSWGESGYIRMTMTTKGVGICGN